MRFRLTTIGVIIALSALACFAQDATGVRVDEFIKTEQRIQRIPGISLAVIKNGEIVLARGYGLANVEHQVAVKPETIFQSGSVGKQFTATAIMMLVEDGKISLEDKINKYFADAPAAWQNITVRHLLTHTAGTTDYPRDFDFRRDYTEDELLKRAQAIPLAFQPGEKWSYSNLGYVVLGILIHKVSGKFYGDYLQERIFKPLGMNATRSTDPQPIVRNRASGYEWKNDHFENRPVLLPAVAFSAGSLLSTVEDMAKWDAALYTEKLLKKSSLDQMWTAPATNDGTDAPFNYGFGWFIENYHGHRLVQHSGGTPGFSSAMYRFVSDKLTIIIRTNHADRILDQLAIDLAGIYLTALKRPDANTDPDPQTTAMLKDVVSGLLKGKAEPESFTAAMRIFLSTATGKAFWKWFADHGELSSFIFSDREDRGDDQVLRYKISLGGNWYWFSVLMTKDGKIAQIYWW